MSYAPAPRPVRFGPRALAELIAPSILMVVGLAAVLGLGVRPVLAEWGLRSTLARSGVVAAGLVDARKEATGGHGAKLSVLHYTWRAGDAPHERTVTVDTAPTTPTVGDGLRIRYLPDHPEISRSEVEIAESAPLLVPVAFVVVTLAVLAVRVASALRDRRLLRLGTPLPATVVRVERIRQGERAHFELISTDGAHVHGRARFPRGAAPAVGAQLTVFCDPQRPRRAVPDGGVWQAS